MNFCLILFLKAAESWFFSSSRQLSFENVCFNHISQIRNALGISGVSSEECAWSKKKDDKEGMQIDLLINRRDNVVNMCEIRFCSSDFTVDSKYYRTLLSRAETLSTMLPIKQSSAAPS